MESGINPVYPPIRTALAAMVEEFTEGGRISREQGSGFLEALRRIFVTTQDFRTKLREFDTVLEQFPAFAPLEPYVFDLLILSFIISDSATMPEDYLESEEWGRIEEDTSDRGSELLNLYLYLSEIAGQGMEPDLEDYLHEFLIAEDELYQDEFELYEEVIRNAALTDAALSQVVDAAKACTQPELQDIFVPLFVFFGPGDRKSKMAELRGERWNRELNLALFGALCGYQDGLKETEMNG